MILNRLLLVSHTFLPAKTVSYTTSEFPSFQQYEKTWDFLNTIHLNLSATGTPATSTGLIQPMTGEWSSLLQMCHFTPYSICPPCDQGPWFPLDFHYFYPLSSIWTRYFHTFPGDPLPKIGGASGAAEISGWSAGNARCAGAETGLWGHRVAFSCLKKLLN